jgi:hypothetical protein
MAGCDPQVFESVTREMLECFSESAESAFGLALTGDEGSASAMGTTLSWNYAPETKQLTLICAEKPMFLSCKDIYEHLGNMLERCRE